MGNQSSNKSINANDLTNIEKINKFYYYIDKIASDIINTKEYNDIIDLNNINYCNDLIILTSNIFNEHLKPLDIELLEERITNGISEKQIKKERIVFSNIKDIEKMDVKDRNLKKRMCLSISRFYIKIAHLYAAILMTLHPVYSFIDLSDNIHKEIPYTQLIDTTEDNKRDLKLNKLGLCYKRIQSIITTELKDVDGKLIGIDIKSELCKLNKITTVDLSGNTISYDKNVQDEPGIPELYLLYMDKYDYTTGKFVGMSDKSKEAYEKDLRLFYQAFTGKKIIPDTIKSFSDIPLREYHKLKSCNKNGILKTGLKINPNNKFISEYGKIVAIMMNNIDNKQKELLKIMEQVFEFDNDTLIIRHDLTNDVLDNLVIQARDIIVSLYIGCESDFNELLKVFEALILDVIQKNKDRQIENIEELYNKELTEQDKLFSGI